jgi:hypothetical protein
MKLCLCLSIKSPRNPLHQQKLEVSGQLNILAALHPVEEQEAVWAPGHRHGLCILENQMPKKIFGSQKEEMTGGWSKLLNEEPCNLYSSPDRITMIKSRRMRLTSHVARMKEKSGACRVLVGKLKGRDY